MSELVTQGDLKRLHELMNIHFHQQEQKRRVAVDALAFMISLSTAQQGPTAIRTLIENIGRSHTPSPDQIENEQELFVVESVTSYLREILQVLEKQHQEEENAARHRTE